MRDKNKTNTDDIDEEFLLATFRDDDVDMERLKGKKEQEKPEGESRKGSSTKSRKKKGDVDYDGEFFKRNEFKARQNVYISQKNHAIISKIIQTIGNREMSVGGYIDLIITEHLEHYESEIMESFRKWKEKQPNNLNDLV